jgi:hypothetical protein
MSQFIYMPNGDQAVRNLNHGHLSAVAVTPSDSTVFNQTRGLFVGGAGNVAVTMADGTTITFNGLAVGVVHLLSVKQVKATGTTATNIVALY